MTAINFPDAPGVSDQVTAGGKVWTWNGTVWNAAPDTDTITEQITNSIVSGSPAALDTLNELAAALGDNPDFAAEVTTSLASKAPTNSPTFTGTVSGVTKAHVGLGDVDNTSDADKPVSTATQDALDLKADLESPTFSGTVTFEEDTLFSGLPAPLSGSSVMTDVSLSTTGPAPVTLTSFTLPEAGTYSVSYTARAQSNLENLSFGTYRVTARATPGPFVLNRQAGDLAVSDSLFISLQANKTYELRASLSTRASFATFSFQTEALAEIGNFGGSFSANSTDPGVTVPAYAVFTPTTNVRVRFVMHAVGNFVQTDTTFGEVSVREITPSRLGVNIPFPLVRLQTPAGAIVPNSELLLSSAGQSSSSSTSIVTVTGETTYNLVGAGALGGINTFLSDQNGRTRVSWFKLSANI